MACAKFQDTDGKTNESRWWTLIGVLAPASNQEQLQRLKDWVEPNLLEPDWGKYRAESNIGRHNSGQAR
jgi:hypothetical protein